MYKILYLPLAKKDLSDIVFYLTDECKAPEVAANLLDELNFAIQRLERFPYSCRVYHSVPLLEDEHRILLVKNYAVFYVVEENTVEIRRIIHAKRDLPKIIMT